VDLRKPEEDVDGLLLGQPLLARGWRERCLDEPSLVVVDGLGRRGRRKRRSGERERRGESGETG
jgi:hypothetical protein